jgi:hypothetical protein
MLARMRFPAQLAFQSKLVHDLSQFVALALAALAKPD